MTKYLGILFVLLMACKAQQPASSQTDALNETSSVTTVSSIPPSASPLTFEVLKEGQYSGYTDAGNLMIMEEGAWKALWSKVGSNQIPPPSLPKVDFSTHLVIAAFMGPQNSGGYSTKITAVQSHESTAYITVSHKKPGENCFVTDALTQPFCIIQIAKGTLNSAAFLTKEETNEC